MVDLKKYYATKDLESYRTEMYYHNLTEAMNQITRVKAIRRFFRKVVTPNAKVLDLGCGSGNDIINLSNEFQKYNASFVGVDLGKELVKKLNLLEIKNTKFVNGDIENVDLKQKFDIVLELEVAEHLEHFDSNLEVIKKHMKPNSYLIMSTPNDKYLLKDILFLFKGF